MKKKGKSTSLLLFLNKSASSVGVVILDVGIEKASYTAAGHLQRDHVRSVCKEQHRKSYRVTVNKAQRVYCFAYFFPFLQTHLNWLLGTTVPQDRPLPLRVTQMSVQFHAESVTKDVFNVVVNVAAVD